jgi:hypothetical protein
MENVLRLAALRPVERAALGDAPRAVRAFNKPGAETKLHRDLRQAARSSPPTDSVSTVASAFLASSGAARGFADVPVLRALDDALVAGRYRLKPAELIELVENAGDMAPAELVASRGFRSMREQLADSLMAASFADASPDLRVALMAGMQLVGLVETLALEPPLLASAADVREQLRRGAVLLPHDIVPPSPVAVAQRAVAEPAPSAVLAGEDRVDAVLGAVGELRAAVDERRAEVHALAERGEIDERTGHDVWNLPAHRRSELSAPTRRLLGELLPHATTVDVIEAITRLEGDAVASSSAALTADGDHRFIRLGGSELPRVHFGEGMELSEIQHTARLAREPGWADLVVIRQEPRGYVAGDLAHVENVLIGETKERMHRQVTTAEQSSTVEEERTRSSEQDNQTTDRFDLQQEAATQSHVDARVQGGVQVTGQYGPAIKVVASAGAAGSFARDESRSESTRFGREVTIRAVEQIQQRVREERSRRTTTAIEDVNKHVLDNADGADHVIGVYRWLDRVYECRPFRYDGRFVLEFEVPEPAALYMWTAARGALADGAVEPTPPLVNGAPLRPDDILPMNFTAWAARYRAEGVQPPPAPLMGVGLSWEEPYKPAAPAADDAPAPAPRVFKGKEWPIPPGYRVLTVHAVLFSDVAWSVAASFGAHWDIRPSGASTSAAKSVEMFWDFGGRRDVRDKLALGLMIDGSAFALTAEVICERTPEELAKWQHDTWAKVMTAYQDRKREYDALVAATRTRAGVAMTARPAARLREIERTELKRSVLTMLRDDEFTDFGAMVAETGTGRPAIWLDRAGAEGPVVQFFEQAFEWSNMTYVFYPYFWGRRPSWSALSQLEDADPLFAEFLRAGSARVVVPVRPGFEELVTHYLATGRVWGAAGKPPQVEDDELYVSVANELRDLRDAPDDGRPHGEMWTLRLPTTLVKLQEDGAIPEYAPDP